jgi:predicted enzyme related to lactoylglutathione lyase
MYEHLMTCARVHAGSVTRRPACLTPAAERWAFATRVTMEPVSLLVTLALLVVAMSPPAAAQIASPLVRSPTNTIIPGEVVFADLVTADVDAAAAFYTSVFGWQLRRSADAGYIEFLHDGAVIGAVAEFRDDVERGGARWLPSISVRDVDRAVTRVERAGGSILHAPEDLPARGRLAVVSDTQGAMFMLLRASGGDPPRSARSADTWGWAELWTQDVARAVGFYEAVFGYRALRSSGRGEGTPVLLTSDGEVRATIVGLSGGRVKPNWLPYVPVVDARDTLARVAASGGAVLLTSEDVDNDSGTFAAIIAGPTGGVFAIQQMEDQP